MSGIQKRWKVLLILCFGLLVLCALLFVPQPEYAQAEERSVYTGTIHPYVGDNNNYYQDISISLSGGTMGQNNGVWNISGKQSTAYLNITVSTGSNSSCRGGTYGTVAVVSYYYISYSLAGGYYTYRDYTRFAACRYEKGGTYAAVGSDLTTAPSGSVKDQFGFDETLFKDIKTTNNTGTQTAQIPLTEDGTYAVTVKTIVWNTRGVLDRALQSDEKVDVGSFIVDSTAPTITVSGGEGTIGKSVSVRYDDRNVSSARYKIGSGSETVFRGEQTFSEEGDYTIIVSDYAGNTSQATFTVDRTSPTLTLSGVENGGFTRGSVSANWSNTVGGKGSTALCRSDDSLTVTWARNSTEYYPFSASNAYVRGQTFSEEGNYLITITDRAGNATSYMFTIDKTAPTLTLSGAEDGGFTRGSVSASWERTVGGVGADLANSSDSLAVRYSRSTDASFPSSSTQSYDSALTEEGNYLITITDRAGNATSYTFTIDTSAPVLSLIGVEQDGFTKGSVSASWTSTTGGVGTQRMNGSDTLTVSYSCETTSAFPSIASSVYASALTEEGNYLVTIADRAGNAMSYKFTIDRSAPVLSLIGVEQDGFTKGEVSAEWSSEAGGIGTQRMNDGDALTVTYSRGTSKDFPGSADTAYSAVLNEEGNYLVTITDRAGNATSYKFTIDRTAPILSLSDVGEGGYTKTNVTVTWDKTAGGVGAQRMNDNDSLTVAYSYLTTAAFPNNTATTYDSILNKEGNYLVTITDRAGNATSYTFTIDKTAPVLTLSGTVSGGFTKSNVSVQWEVTVSGVGGQRANDGDALAVTYSRETGKDFPRSAGTAYNGSLEEEGNYLITITDRAGNATSYTFTIDRTAPVLTLSGVENGGFTKGSVSISWNTDIGGVHTQRSNQNDALNVVYAQSRDASIPSSASTTAYQNSSFSSEGNYLITITDRAGNATSYKFTIDTTAPMLSLVTVDNGGATKENVTLQWGTTAGGVGTQRANDNDSLIVRYSHSATAAFPDRAEEPYSAALSAEGNYLVTIADRAGNATSYKFTIDKTAPVLSLSGAENGGFTKDSVSASWGKTIGGVGAQCAYDGDTLVVRYSHSVTAAFPENAETTYVSALTREGNYRITITDRAGNSTSYTFTIDRTAPVLTLSGVVEGGFTKDSVSASWGKTIGGVGADFTNANDTLIVRYSLERDNDFPTASTEPYSSALTAEGNYLVTIADRAGNATSYKFTIDRSAPVLSLIGVEQDGFTKGEVSAEWSSEAGGVGTQRMNDGDVLAVTYSRGTSKDFPRSAGTAYKGALNEEGNYLVTITDRAGNATSYKFTIDKTAPILIIEGTTDGGFTRGEVSLTAEQDVGGVGAQRMNDSDALTVTYSYLTSEFFPDRATEAYSSALTAEGNYLVTVTDRAGNDTSYKFTIDKTAPVLSLIGVEQGGFTKGEVSAEWGSEAGGVGTQRMSDSDALTVTYSCLTSELFPDRATTAYSSALTSEGNYLVTIADRAGNAMSYKFTIDRSAPTLSLSGAENGGFTKENVSANWSEGVGGVGTQRMNDVDALIVTYSYLTMSAFPKNAETAYKGSLEEEGNYLIMITDRAGNATSYTFTIDRSAPMLSLIGVAENGFTKEEVFAEWGSEAGGVGTQRMNDGDVLAVTYSRGTSKDFPRSAGTAYKGALNEEGNYLVTITDRAGNATSYKFTIDKTAPILIIEGTTDGGFTRGEVSLTAEQDVGGVGAQRMNDSDALTVTYSYLTSEFFPDRATEAYSSALTAEGNYLITITDRAGNATSYMFTIDKTAPVLIIEGTTDGGFTRGEVSLTAEQDVGGVGAQRMNGSDTLTVSYSCETTSAFPSIASSVYASALTEEGNYLVTIADRAGNATSYKFAIDRTAPVLSLIGVAEDGFAKGEVSVEWSSKAGGVGAQRINGSDVLTVTYSYLMTSAFPKNAETAYKGAFNEEGNYLVTITDRAGNATSYTFTIDATAPTLSFDTVKNGGATKENTTPFWSSEAGGVGTQRMNDGDALTVTYDYLEDRFPAVATRLYVGTFTEQGRYRVTITDRAGNATSYTFTLDKTAPILLVNADMVGAHSIYGKSPVVAWSDNYMDVTGIEIIRNALILSPRLIEAGEAARYEIAYGEEIQQSGIYTVTLTDSVGNESHFVFAVISAVDSFNRESLERSGYLKQGNYRVKIPYMKTITIPAIGKDGKQSQYPGAWSNAEIYVFASYENALRFMVEIEIEEAVTNNGNGLFTYYQINNHSATITYGDVEGARASMEEMYRALEKYASAYVTEYNLPSLTSPYIGNNTTIMDLEVLAGVTENGEQRIGGDYVFKNKIHKIVFGDEVFVYDSLVKLYIAREDDSIYDGAYRVSETFWGYIGSASASGTTGGTYVVTETDALGNELTYRVYFDRTAPTFLAQYTYFHAQTDEHGDMQSEIISAEIELSSNHQIDGNLKTLSIAELLDNSDSIITAVVIRPNGTTITTSDRSLLTFGEGGQFADGGEYHVKLYDRTGNLFDYAFTIYGGAPQVSAQIRGTGDNRNITISFANANSYSSIVNFAIYRYGVRLPEGEYSETVDGKVLNTIYIEQGVWSYRFVLGGVYTVRFKDSFGCVTESEEIIFAKGLPSYTLSGVNENGKTRKSVSLSFESSAGYEVRKDGELVTMSALSVADGQRLDFAATENNNGTWAIKLYVKSDPNTYLTVRFTIDTTAPTATAEDGNGEVIAWDTTVRTAFRIVWSDADVVRVQYKIGDGLQKSYNIGDLLDEDGAYTVTLTDDAGNSTVYLLTKDTAVLYAIEYSGTRYNAESVVFARGGFSVVNKEWLEIAISRDGAAVEIPRFRFEYTAEGRYEIVLRDSFGNQAIAVVVIDKTPPRITVRHGADAFSPVMVEVESADVQSFTIRKDGKNYDVELADTMTFTEWGTYECTLKDALGNVCTESFAIAKIPPKAEIFTVDGEAVASGDDTNKAVYVVWDDAMATGRVSLPNGLSKVYTQRTVLMEEGTYTVKVTDAAGNAVEVSVTIARTIPYTLMDGNGEKLQTLWYNGMLNTTQTFLLDFAEGLEVTAEKDGAPFDYHAGQKIDTDGSYTFYLSDGIGNTECVMINRDATPPEVVIRYGDKSTDAVTVLVDEQSAEIRLVHLAAGKKYTTVLTGKTEYVFGEWGDYTLEATDLLGNKTEKMFTVAKIPPQVQVVTIAGEPVAEGATVNSSVTIECSEEDATIRYRVDSEAFSHIYKADTVLSAQGSYEIIVTDIADTKVTLTFTLDSEVVMGAWIDGISIRDFDIELAGREYADFEFGEALMIECLRNGEPYAVTAGESLHIDGEGQYILTLTDAAGNLRTVEFLIDRTAPAFELSTDDEVTKDDVAVMLTDLSDIASYQLTTDGRRAKNFVLDTVNTFAEEASYRLTLADALGNSATAEFRIRRSIDYVLSIPEGFIASGAVTLSLRQAATVLAMRNGERIDTAAENGAYSFTVDGVYSLSLTDDLGNVAELAFSIKENPYTARFEYTIPRDSTYKLTRDGIVLAQEEYVQGDKIVADKDGKYTLTLRRGGRTGIYNFIVDTALPVLILNGEEYRPGDALPRFKSDFTIGANKSGCTIEVFFNGVSIPYSTDAQSANGEYRIVITDALGNVAEYVFHKDFTFNAGSIVLFAVAGTTVALVVLLIIRRRIKMRIR